MRNSANLALIALLTAPASLLAEVPHTFSAGTPAKASEVNANFEALDNAIGVLKSDQASQKALNSAALKDANGAIDGLNTKMDTLSGDVNKANKSIADANTAINTVKGSAAANTNAIQLLQGSQSQTDGAINQINQTLQNVPSAQQLQALQTGQTNQAASIQTLDTALKGLTTSTSTQQQSIDKNKSDIAANKKSIEQNQQAAQSNKSAADLNKESIISAQADIASNKTGIASNTTGIASNKTGIASNKTGIAANKSGLTTNTAAIANMNTALNQANANIATQDSSIKQNSTQGTTNASAITTNQSSISTNSSDIQDNKTALNTLATELMSFEPLKERTISVYKPTYTAKNHPFTDPISIGNATFRLVKLPFIEFGSGDKYTLTIPTIAVTNANNELNLQTSLDSLHLDSEITSNLTVSGFPAMLVSLVDGNSVSVVTQKSDGSHGNRMRVVQSSSLSLTVVINKTTIRLNFSVSKVVIDKDTLTTGDFDYSQGIDWSLMQQNNQLRTFVDDLIDYVEITKVTP